MRKCYLISILFLSLTSQILSQSSFSDFNSEDTDWELIFDQRSAYVLHITKDGNLLVGTFNSGLYFSSDFGETWIHTDFNNNISILSIVELDDGRIITGRMGVFRSTDDLLSYEPILSKYINKLYKDEDHNLYATVNWEGVYKSTDNGDSWFPWYNLGGYSHAWDMVQAKDSIYLVAYQIENFPFSLSRTTNSGITWFIIDNEHYRKFQKFDSKLYARKYGLLLSEDFGLTWDEVNLPAYVNNYISDFIINEDGIIFICGKEAIYYSRDQGGNWIGISHQGLNNEWFDSIYLFRDSLIFSINRQKVYKKSLDFLSPVKINYQNNLEFNLTQNYPNPFNPSTTIKYQIPDLSFVILKVYDVLGDEVVTLIKEEIPAGSYEAEFNGNELTSGIYFYRLQAGDFIDTKKMILLK